MCVLQLSQGDLAEPCLPPAINVWRGVSFAGGAWGAVVAILVNQYPSELSGDIKFAVLAGGLLLLFGFGFWWYLRWRRTTRVYDEQRHKWMFVLDTAPQRRPSEMELGVLPGQH